MILVVYIIMFLLWTYGFLLIFYFNKKKLGIISLAMAIFFSNIVILNYLKEILDKFQN